MDKIVEKFDSVPPQLENCKKYAYFVYSKIAD